MVLKTCRGCGDPKPLDAFHLHKEGALGRHPRCKVCRSRQDADHHERTKHEHVSERRAYSRRYYRVNKVTVNAKTVALNAAWRRANPAENRSRKRIAYLALRTQIIAKLGARCPCGFANPLALHIEHTNGGGTAELRGKARETWYRQILRGTNPSPVELLCANCNWRRRLAKQTGNFPDANHIVLRKRAVAHLGGRCDCGETDVDVLHVDHVKGGGTEERRSKSRAAYYRDMLDAPEGTYQVRCCNCNWIKKNTNAAERPGRKDESVRVATCVCAVEPT